MHPITIKTIYEIFPSLNHINDESLLRSFFLEEFNQYDYKFDLPEELIRDFSDELDWVHLLSRQSFSESFIRENIILFDINGICWIMISIYQTLSEEFIREFADKIVWKYLLKNNNLELTEAFYEEFRDKLNAS